MASATKRTSAELDADLERSQPEEIAQAELVVGQRSTSAPISVRLSAPLLERLDRLAAAEHRKRGNLIQHILWQYVRKHRA
jgi:predicted DNA binding CopG/RHH family protein